MFIIKILFGPRGIPVQDGRYLVDCDFNQGYTPKLRTSTKPSEAKKFNSQIEALEYWKTPSSVLPTRPDGKPNRPLSAYTITVEQYNGD